MYAVERKKDGELSLVMNFDERGNSYVPVFPSMDAAIGFCEEHSEGFEGYDYKVVQVEII